MKTVAEIIKPFCALVLGRYAMDKPFEYDDKVIATDGRILIWAHNKDREHGEFENDNHPDMSGNTFAETLSPTIDESITNIELPPLEEEDCETCRGAGILDNVDCDECDGHGWLECDLGHEHDCEDCNGTGKAGVGECRQCFGAKKLPKEEFVKIGDTKFDARYLYKMRNLEDFQWGQISFAGEGRTFLWKHGGGIVMGVSDDD